MENPLAAPGMLQHPSSSEDEPHQTPDRAWWGGKENPGFPNPQFEHGTKTTPKPHGEELPGQGWPQGLVLL